VLHAFRRSFDDPPSAHDRDTPAQRTLRPMAASTSPPSTPLAVHSQNYRLHVAVMSTTAASRPSRHVPRVERGREPARAACSRRGCERQRLVWCGPNSLECLTTIHAALASANLVAGGNRCHNTGFQREESSTIRPRNSDATVVVWARTAISWRRCWPRSRRCDGGLSGGAAARRIVGRGMTSLRDPSPPHHRTRTLPQRSRLRGDDLPTRRHDANPERRVAEDRKTRPARVHRCSRS